MSRRRVVALLAAAVATLVGVAAPAQAVVTRPVVTRMSVGAGTTAGGQPVVIFGKRLDDVTSVQFGSLSATGVHALSDGKVLAIAPAAPAGAVDVTVTSMSLTSAVSPGGRFTYTDPGLPALQSVHTPHPGDVSDTPADQSEAMSCPAARSCIGLENYSSSDGERSAFEVLHGTTWTPVEVQLPGDAVSGSPGLTAMSCPAPGLCFAVGQYETADGPRGLFATLRAGQATSVQAPSDATSPGDYQAGLTAISCGLSTFCVVLGDYSGDINELTFDEYRNGTFVRVDRDSDENDLAWVTCAQRSCIAMGLADDGTLAILSRDSDGWHRIYPVAPGHGEDFAVPQADCWAAGYCYLVGSYQSYPGGGPPSGARYAFIDSVRHEQVKSVPVPRPPGAQQTDEVDLSDISCNGKGQCTATGTYEDDALGEIPFASTVSNGAATNSIEIPGYEQQFDLSCGTPDYCQGLGSGGLETLSDGIWTIAGIPLPPDVGSASQTGVFANACGSAGFCAVFGDYYDDNDNTLGYLVSPA